MTPERWQQIKPVLADALEMNLTERKVFLAKICAEDAALRIEVESLLAAQEEAQSFIEQPAFNHTALFPEPNGFALPPQQIGSYRIVRALAHGGMGAVYLAERDDNLYRQKVAIKLIKRGMDTAFVLQRFRAERQILAALAHPNIARLLDGGTTADGSPYLVMEYIEGVPIDQYCDAHKLSISERLKLFRQVCSAVQFAHQRLVIHRDLKPGNILVTATGEVKLLDFGIAKLLLPDENNVTIDPTATGMRLMTPAYASPEQIREEPVTTASDVYSLGVILYELLTGHRPYQVKGAQTHELLRAVCETDPERPSAVIPRIEEERNADGTTARKVTPEQVSQTREGQPSKLRRRLRGDIDNIVLMALRKEPARRYPSVEQLSEDIRRHLEGLPVLAHKATVSYRTQRFMRRHRAAILSASVVALILMLVGAALLVMVARRKPVSSVAVLPFNNVTHDPSTQYLAQGITDELTDKLSEMPGLKVASRASAARISATQEQADLQATGQTLAVEMVVTGKLVARGEEMDATVELFDVGKKANVWSKQYRFRQAEMLRLQEEIAREVTENLGLKLRGQEERLLTRRYTDNVEAYHLYLKGRYFWDRRTEESLKQSITYYEQAIEKDHDFALAYAGLAATYDILGYLTPPQQAYAKAEEAALTALRLDDTLPEAHITLANIRYNFTWDWIAAEREFKRALQLNPNRGLTHMWYADMLMKTGRFDEALLEIDSALRLDPLNLVANANKGTFLFYSRRYTEAIEQCRKTLQLEPRLAAAHLVLAGILIEQGQAAAAIEELRTGIKVGGGVEYQALTAYCYGVMNKRADAQQALNEVLRLSRQRYVQPYWIAVAYVGLGEKEKAFEYLEQGFAEHSPWMSSLALSPRFDSLRSDPRFLNLLHRMNLTP